MRTSKIISNSLPITKQIVLKANLLSTLLPVICIAVFCVNLYLASPVCQAKEISGGYEIHPPWNLMNSKLKPRYGLIIQTEVSLEKACKGLVEQNRGFLGGFSEYIRGAKFYGIVYLLSPNLNFYVLLRNTYLLFAPSNAHVNDLPYADLRALIKREIYQLEKWRAVQLSDVDLKQILSLLDKHGICGAIEKEDDQWIFKVEKRTTPKKP